MFAEIAWQNDRAAQALLGFLQNDPPASEREWRVFYQNMFGVVDSIRQMRSTALEGLDIARENGIVDAQSPDDALRQLRDEIDKILDD